MDCITIIPGRRLELNLEMPGDKSISHRAAILAAISDQRVVLDHFASGDDCTTTLNCLKLLGVPVFCDGDKVIIQGVGKYGLSKPPQSLDCRNSGTTARLLSGILAGQAFDSVLIGDDSLSKRPMNRVMEPLRMMGSDITATDSGFLPLTIHGKSLQGINYALPMASAQVKSCVLFAGMYADGETTVNETVPTRDHTERLMKNVRVHDSGKAITIDPREPLLMADMVIPGDFSSAAFFIAAAALVKDSRVRIRHVSLNPTRIGLLDRFQEMGLTITVENFVEADEPYGDLIAAYETDVFRKVSLNRPLIASVIDELPILAVLGTRCEGGMEIRNAGELRKKETDRIRAVVGNLRAMGITVDEFDDGMYIHQGKLRGAILNSYGDHRVAMAFSVAALAASGESIIQDASCASISFPEFYRFLGVSAGQQTAIEM